MNPDPPGCNADMCLISFVKPVADAGATEKDAVPDKARFLLRRSSFSPRWMEASFMVNWTRSSSLLSFSFKGVPGPLVTGASSLAKPTKFEVFIHAIPILIRAVSNVSSVLMVGKEYENVDGARVGMQGLDEETGESKSRAKRSSAYVTVMNPMPADIIMLVKNVGYATRHHVGCKTIVVYQKCA